MTNYELIKKCETIDDLAVVLNNLFDCPKGYYDCPDVLMPCKKMYVIIS